MAIVVPNSAELNILRRAVLGDAGGLRLCLYKNDFTPDENTVLADLVEANFDGYTRAGGFSVPVTGGDGKAKTEKLNFVWTKAAGEVANTVHGWFVVWVDGAGANPELYACERSAAPQPMFGTGDTITKSVTLTLRQDA